MATAWLKRTFQPYAAAEPRFWTVPPSYHVQELTFCVLMSSGAAVCAALRRRQSNSAPPPLPIQRSALESAFGFWLALWPPANFCNKRFIQQMETDRALTEMFLPCHIFNITAAYCFLSTSARARVGAYNLLLYCAWMPVLAMLFPDLESSRAIVDPVRAQPHAPKFLEPKPLRSRTASEATSAAVDLLASSAATQVLRTISLGMFWGHHLTILVVPVTVHALASRRRRFAPPAPRGAGLLQYLAFIYAFIGVFLCVRAAAPSLPARAPTPRRPAPPPFRTPLSASPRTQTLALATGRNINYSLWPPSLPAAVTTRLGGARYRCGRPPTERLPDSSCRARRRQLSAILQRRLTVGTGLAFVFGPLMRLAVVPGVSSMFGRVWLGAAGDGRHARAKTS